MQHTKKGPGGTADTQGSYAATSQAGPSTPPRHATPRFGRTRTLRPIQHPDTPAAAELGINFSQIQARTLNVLNPFSTTEQSIMQEADLAGPLVFCLMFGATLLATGR